jgi:hypothetical protein
MTEVRIVWLNAFSPSMLPSARRFIVSFERVGGLAELRQRLQEELGQLGPAAARHVHYVRHPATLALLRQHFPELPETPSTGLYTYQPGDIMVIVTLRSPARGQEVATVRPEDLDIIVARVESAV